MILTFLNMCYVTSPKLLVEGKARDVTYLKPYFVAFTTSARRWATDNPSKFLRHNLIKRKRLYANFLQRQRTRNSPYLPCVWVDIQLNWRLFSRRTEISLSETNDGWWYICTPTYSLSLILSYSCWMVFILAFETRYHLPKGKSPSHFTRKRGRDFADDILVKMLKFFFLFTRCELNLYIRSKSNHENEKYMTLHFFRNRTNNTRDL